MVSVVSEEHTPVLLHKTLTLLKQNKIVDWNVKRCSIIIGFLIRHQIEYSASGITLRLDLAGHQGFREWLLQLPWFNKGWKLLDVEKGIKSDKKINYINRKRKKKNPQHSANVSEQTHSTENYGSPVRLDTSNSSSPQLTLERPVESKAQIEVGTLKELVYCVSTGRLMLQPRNIPLPLPPNE